MDTLHSQEKKKNSIFEWLLDIVFPRRCLQCHAFDTWLCADCASIIPILHEQHCFVCRDAVTRNGELCASCETDSDTSLDGIFIISTYEHPIVKKMIHHLKYRYIIDLSDALGVAAAQALMHSSLPSPDLIIPVPLHPRRLRDRGFNQAEMIARSIGLTIPVRIDLLERIRFTKPQVHKKSRALRCANLSGAFAITDEDLVCDKSILLVDDVTTTGTTLEESASVLRDAGAASVHALVIARD